MAASYQKSIYANLIAGRLPVGSGSAQKVVMNHAYAILGSNRLHCYCLERAGYVYFFAIESIHLASEPGFKLPLVDALPGMPLHRGDGIYTVNGPDYAAALIIEAGSVRLLCQEPELLKDYLAGLDLRITELPATAGQSLSSIPQAIHGITERVSGFILKASYGVLLLSGVTFVGAQAATAYTQSKNIDGLNPKAVENDLNTTLKKLSVQQPLARQLSRIQKVSSTVVRSGGWIERYHLKGEGHEQFEVVLPSWVSQDYLDALGRDVVTDLRDMEGLLTVRKLDKER
ncbi:hypothetical protein [Limnobacter sp.]|uniref:hypothetical protein n=1 Tax=Limnobacter sp. TaxID=2003368 RepID=UPI0035197B8C